MFDTLSRLTSRIARRCRPKRPAAAVAHVASLLAVGLTLIMVGSGHVAESNPVSAWLHAQIGLSAWALLTPIGVGAALSLVDQLPFERAKWAIAGALGLDAVSNLATTASVGLPASILVTSASATIVGTMLVAGVVYWHSELGDVIASVPRPSLESVQAVAFSTIMLTSMVGGVAFVGTQPFGDSDHDGTASAAGGDIEWEYATGDSVKSSPTVVDGTVYVGSMDNSVYALDKDTGGVKWEYATGNSVFSSPTVANGTVYVGSYDNSVYALDAETGNVKWEYTTGDSIKSSPTVKDGTVYVGSYDNSTYALDAETGDEKWNYTTGNAVSSSPSVVGGTVYVGSHDNSTYALDAETGAEEWEFKTGGTVHSSPTVVDGTVYFGSHDRNLYAIDADTGTENWNFTTSTNSNAKLRSSPTVKDGSVYIGAWPSNVFSLDAETGAKNWESEAPGGQVRTSPTVADGTVYAGSTDETLYAFDADTGGVKWSKQVSSNSHYIRSSPTVADGTVYFGSNDNTLYALDTDITGSSEGSRSNLGTLGHYGDMVPTDPVTVQVTDQDGNPVNDSTVQATVVDQNALDTSNLNQTAQELLDDAENPEPPSYDARMNLNSEFDNVDAEYVSVHPESQMSTIEASTGGLDPDVQVRSGEEIYLMSWDATDEPGFLSTDLINRQLPGSPTSSTIVIEQLDHSGDVTETRELTTEDPESTASIGYVDILDDYSRTHVSTSLPDGFYRISTKNSNFEYVIAVGNPAQIIEQELKDEADRLTDHAQKMQDRHNNGIFQTVTGSTNATGETTLDIPKSASVIQVQAYKGPDASVVGASTTADITMQDVRDSREAGYDEAIYLSTEPKRVDMSTTDGSVTVEMHKLDGSPMSNMTDWEQRLEDLLNERLNASIAELESAYDDRLETVEREELERRHDDLRTIVDRAGLMDRVEELLGRSLEDTATGSDAELQEDLRSMEQALGEQQSQGSSGETTTEIDSGELFTEIPFASEIDPEAISVIVHTEAGESITLPDSEYRIESNGIIDGGDMVVIDGYQLPTNTAVADVEVRGVSPAGRTLRERVSAVNPTMAGNVPGLDAIDVNTMRPGPDERVGLQLRPSDPDAYDSISSVDVYGPDGQTVPATLDGERAYFDTEGEGVYTVRATYAGSDGTEFVETIRLRAGSRMISERPTVRVTEGLTGPTAIVGQGLDSATIETVGGETVITVRQPGDATSAPGEIHIEAQQLDASGTISVNVVRGELEESVNAHTNVVLHTNEIGDDSLVYRDGKPVTADGDTKYGEYETRENPDGVTKTVIYTYSEADGTVQMRISEDPGVVERVFFDLRVRSPVDVPLVGLLYGAVELTDSVPLGPTAALQTVDTPELREADPGAIVPSTCVVNTPGVVDA